MTGVLLTCALLTMEIMPDLASMYPKNPKVQVGRALNTRTAWVNLIIQSGPHLQKRGPIQIFSINFDIEYVLPNQFTSV